MKTIDFINSVQSSRVLDRVLIFKEREIMITEEIQFSQGKPVPYEVYVTDNKNLIKRHIAEILQLVNDSYTELGGNTSADTQEKILKNTAIAKFVFNSAGDIIALSLYRIDRGGNKRYCSASRKSDPAYKAAVQAIIKNDIEPYDNWYWAEVSNKIEHYFKKLGGNPIPNYLAYKFLRKPKKDIILLDDGVHYQRRLNSVDSTALTKAIYGFKSEEMMKLVMSKIDNYENFKIAANSIVDELHEDEEDVSDDTRSLEAASIIVQELDEFHDAGFTEMLPSWKKQLLQAIARLLDEQSKTGISSKQKSYIKSNLDTAKYLIKHMPLLQFRQVKVDEMF